MPKHDHASALDALCRRRRNRGQVTYLVWGTPKAHVGRWKSPAEVVEVRDGEQQEEQDLRVEIKFLATNTLTPPWSA